MKDFVKEVFHVYEHGNANPDRIDDKTSERFGVLSVIRPVSMQFLQRWILFLKYLNKVSFRCFMSFKESMSHWRVGSIKESWFKQERCWPVRLVVWLVWVLWHFNLCRLFNAKSILKKIALFHTIQFRISTQFKCKYNLIVKNISISSYSVYSNSSNSANSV